MPRPLRFVYVIYCMTAGMMFCMMPWSPAWDRLLALLPYQNLMWLSSPWSRGVLTGFGLVHLVWSVYDLHIFLLESVNASMDKSKG